MAKHTRGPAKAGDTHLIMFESYVLMRDEVGNFKKNEELGFPQNLSCCSTKNENYCDFGIFSLTHFLFKF